MTETSGKKVASPLQVFISRSGYHGDDVISHNDRLRIFATSNGGKYQLLKNGTIRTMKGPEYPRFVPTE